MYFYAFDFSGSFSVVLGSWDLGLNQYGGVKEFGYCSEEGLYNPQFEMCGCSGRSVFRSIYIGFIRVWPRKCKITY